jgi:hypothetical protein
MRQCWLDEGRVVIGPIDGPLWLVLVVSTIASETTSVAARRRSVLCRSHPFGMLPWTVTAHLYTLKNVEVVGNGSSSGC